MIHRDIRKRICGNQRPVSGYGPPRKRDKNEIFISAYEFILAIRIPRISMSTFVHLFSMSTFVHLCMCARTSDGQNTIRFFFSYQL